MTDSLQATEDYSAARATAPRVSLDDIKDNIETVHYFTAGQALAALGQPVSETGSLDLLTICIVTVHNGFTVVGKSAPASADNFDAEKGRTFAYEDAVRQLWPLMGYELREALYRGEVMREAV